MYSRIVPDTSMLPRPFMRPAALPQPALGNEAPAPPLPVLGAPATLEAPPPPAATTLPALPPDPPAVPAGVPPAFICPAAAGAVPPVPGAPAFCSPDVPAVGVEPPLATIDPPVPPLPPGPALSELEQAIAQGRSATARPNTRKDWECPGCMIFFSLAGSMNSEPEAVTPAMRERAEDGHSKAEFEIHAAPQSVLNPMRRSL